MTNRKYSFLLFLAIFAFGETAENCNSHDFCYSKDSCNEDKGNWGGQCQTKGEHQSPANLITKGGSTQTKKVVAFNNNYNVDNFYIVNNGHTVQVQFNPNAATSDAELTVGGLTGTYKFAQLHFHWGNDANHGSEHKVDSVQYSMEAHFVHYSSKFENVSDAAKSGGINALAVVGVFLDVRHPLQGEFFINEQVNRALGIIGDAIPGYNEKPNQVNSKLNLKPFLPAQGDKVLQYNGSLTTPCCNEIVYWTVKQAPFKVTDANVRKFLAMKGKDGKTYGKNYRSVSERRLQLDPITVQ